MARMPRGIELDREGQYHLRGQAAGPKGHYPLQQEANAEKLLEIIRHFTALYFCAVAGLELMGSHYHLVCRFEAFRVLGPEELLEHAEAFYPGAYKPYRGGDRPSGPFQPTPVQCVRTDAQYPAGVYPVVQHRERPKRRLLGRPIRLDGIGQSGGDGLLHRTQRGEGEAAQSSRAVALLLGVDATEPGGGLAHAARRAHGLRRSGRGREALLGDPVLEGDAGQQRDRRADPGGIGRTDGREQFERGCYLTRRDFFTRGRQIGTREAIKSSLKRCRERGIYRRRMNPLPVGVGNLYALREIRGSYFRI